MLRTILRSHLAPRVASCYQNTRLIRPSVVQVRELQTNNTLKDNGATKPFEEVLGNTPITNYPKPEFLDHKEVFKHKKTVELVRAYLVFTMCSFDFLLKHHVRVLHILRKVLGRRLFRLVMKTTMYGQFMAGEKSEEVLKVSQRLVPSGLYPMFAYTAGESHGQACDTGPKDHAIIWDKNFEALQEAIEMAAKSKDFAPVTPQLSSKFTFLADANLLQRVSEVITHNETVCTETLLRSVQPLADEEKIPRLKETCEELTKLLMQSSWPGFEIPLPPCGAVDNRAPYLPSLLTHMPFHLVAEDVQDNGQWRLPPQWELNPSPACEIIQSLPLKGIKAEDRELLVQLWVRVLELGQKAKNSGVKLIWDAEQTYLQPAIEALILDSMRILNTDSPVIANTYQCYLKRTDKIISRDLQLAATEDFCLGAKIVRGAYMDEERTLAHVHNYEDPVNPSYEATTEQYYEVAGIFMDEMKSYMDRGMNGRLEATFATHNADTVLHVLDGLQQRNIETKDGTVRFAQLYGTRDYISFALGQSGYPAAKLIHFGDIEEGVMYLSRRVQENRSGVPTASLERQMLQAELSRRLLKST